MKYILLLFLLIKQHYFFYGITIGNLKPSRSNSNVFFCIEKPVLNVGMISDLQIKLINYTGTANSFKYIQCLKADPNHTNL